MVIARQVAEIARRAALGAEGNSTAPADSAKPQPSAAQGGKEEKKEGFAPGQSKAPAGTGATGSFSAQTERRGFPRGEAAKGGRPDFKRPLKRSDHPDVIYGRDFQEEAIPIEDIEGEMGEVVIRGKIISFDSREIRNQKTILMFDVTDFTDTITIKI